MTTKIHADTGIEFPDSTVQGSAAYTKAQSDAANPNIAFSAFQASDPSRAFPVGTAVVPAYTTVIRNDGGGYNPANTVFTAPVAGWYMFSCGCAMHNAVAYSDIQLRFNDNLNVERLVNGNDIGALQTSLIVYLAAGATLTPYYLQSSVQQMFQGWNQWQAWFQGALIRKA